jgi:hypothetical protein
MLAYLVDTCLWVKKVKPELMRQCVELTTVPLLLNRRIEGSLHVVANPVDDRQDPLEMRI